MTAGTGALNHAMPCGWHQTLHCTADHQVVEVNRNKLPKQLRLHGASHNTPLS